jgi:hypothetical protein
MATRVSWSCSCGRRFVRDVDGFEPFEHRCPCGKAGKVRPRAPDTAEREKAVKLAALASAPGGSEHEKAAAARALARLIYERPELVATPPAPVAQKPVTVEDVFELVKSAKKKSGGVVLEEVERLAREKGWL